MMNPYTSDFMKTPISAVGSAAGNQESPADGLVVGPVPHPLAMSASLLGPFIAELE